MAEELTLRKSGRGGASDKRTVPQEREPEAELASALKIIDAQRAQIATTFDVVTDAIVVIDDRGIVESVNGAACTMFDRPSFDLVHHSIERLIPDPLDLGQDRADTLGTAPSRRPTQTVRNVTGINARDRRFPIAVTLAVIPESIDGRRRYVATIRDLTEDQAKEDQIRFLAYHDEITRLPNQVGINRFLDSYFEGGPSGSLVLVQIALNNLGTLAASFGVEESDRYIIAFAQRLRRLFGDAMLIGRGYGNSFYLLLPLAGEATLRDALETVAGEPIEISDMHVAVDICVGTLRLPDQAGSPREAVHRVAATLFEARSLPRLRGRSRLVTYAPSIMKSMRKRTTLVHQIRQAISNEEFAVYLQPRIDITTDQWVGAEALARWSQPDGSMIPPGDFIPAAEQAGLVTDLNRGIFLETLNRFSESDWDRQSAISINISAQDLTDPAFTADIASALRLYNLPASAIELELTERDIVSGSHIMLATIDGLRDLGVAIAMDDFGTGYSSLAALADLPIDILKIDRQFLRKIEEREADRRVLATLVSLANDLDRLVVVEGVETEAQADYLKSIGVRYAQGFLYAKPAPAIAVLNDDRRPAA